MKQEQFIWTDNHGVDMTIPKRRRRFSSYRDKPATGVRVQYPSHWKTKDRSASLPIERIRVNLVTGDSKLNSHLRRAMMTVAWRAARKPVSVKALAEKICTTAKKWQHSLSFLKSMTAAERT